ncbi:MAG: putative prophage phiRv2 integrase [Frankiales bacterium]|nr:putative prophage phiRv2 integrase [Frankiales bacterium]
MAAARRDWGRVRRLPSGRWQARYPGPDGLLRPAPDTFVRKAEATDWLANKRTEISRDDWINPDFAAVTLREFGSRWIRERRIAETTRERYEFAFEKHVIPHIGELPLGKIRDQTIRSWYARLHDSEVGTASISKAYRLLHAIFSTAVDDLLVRRNPCRIKGASSDRSAERSVLSIEEVFRIAGAVPPRYRALILLAAFTSLRFGELAALQRRHVDLGAQEISVRRSQAELRGGRRLIKDPKSGAGIRDVAVPAEILAELWDHLVKFIEPGDEALVFSGPKGGSLRRHNFRKIWLDALVEAHVARTDVHFHDLRHTGNDLAAKTGASTRELMARMGHASMRAALIYQHASRDRDREIASQINSNLMRSRPQPRASNKDQGHVAGTSNEEAG